MLLLWHPSEFLRGFILTALMKCFHSLLQLLTVFQGLRLRCPIKSTLGQQILLSGKFPRGVFLDWLTEYFELTPLLQHNFAIKNKTKTKKTTICIFCFCKKTKNKSHLSVSYTDPLSLWQSAISAYKGRTERFWIKECFSAGRQRRVGFVQSGDKRRKMN